MSALVDPGLDCRDLFVGQLAIHRHCRPLETRDTAVQAAFLSVTGNNRRSFLTALQSTLERTQVEFRKLQGLAVTFPAATLQDWLNVLCKGNRLLRA